MIKVEKFMVNPLAENSFVLSDETGEAVLIDPGFYFEEEHSAITDYIESNNLTPIKIVNTHCHFDHIMGVEFIRNKYNIPFYIHPEDEFWIEQAEKQAGIYGFEMNAVSPANNFLAENIPVKFGKSELNVIHIPGHTPGHVVFYSEPDKILVAGDVLFYGSIGRTDLPGGDHNTLITNIKEKLLPLPGETKVYCGHGQETTIDFEKNNNPFLT